MTSLLGILGSVHPPPTFKNRVDLFLEVVKLEWSKESERAQMKRHHRWH